MVVGRTRNIGGPTAGSTAATGTSAAATPESGKRQAALAVAGVVCALIVFEFATSGSSNKSAQPRAERSVLNLDSLNRKSMEVRAAPSVKLAGAHEVRGDAASAESLRHAVDDDAKPAAPPSAAPKASKLADAKPTPAEPNYSEEKPKSDASAVPAVGTDGPETKPACYPACYPFFVRSGQLYVQRKPSKFMEPSVYRAGAVKPGKDGRPVYAFSPEIKRVVIDIGTHAQPDSVEDFWNEKDTGFVWFEPIVSLQTHQIHVPETRKVQGIDVGRVVGVPAAVAPKPGHMGIFLSAVSGCTSLLEMNDEAIKKPEVMKGSFVGSDSAFKNYGDWKSGFTGCLEKVKGRPNREIIPVVRGEDVMGMVPPEINVHMLATDAQGFDLQVVSSFGTSMRRADLILVECQDLPEGHGMFLTKGASSCADIRACMKQYSPEHVLIDPKTGEPSNACAINNPSHERNCLYRKMHRPHFRRTPNLLKRPAYKIKYEPKKDLTCPSLARPEGLQLLGPNDQDNHLAI